MNKVHIRKNPNDIVRADKGLSFYFVVGLYGIL